MSYGHALAAAGRQQESIAAYRRCIALAPACGEAYYSLANLKTFLFSDAELQSMRAQVENKNLGNEDRAHFHFAVGKALEDSKDFAESFEHYARANELRRPRLGYDAAENSAFVQRSKRLFTRDFFAAREEFGAEAADPIFIVGLPRAGSTLLEQILATRRWKAPRNCRIS